MEDIIFGGQATEALRMKHIHSRIGGVTHNGLRTPRDPLPGQPIRIDLDVGPEHPGQQAWVYWTNDGSDPIGELGHASHGNVTFMQPIGSRWETLEWGYVQRFQATLPGQAPDTVLRYRLSTLEPGGSEVFADQGAYYAFYVDDDPYPDWSRDAVVYQVFVERFSPGNGKTWLSPETRAGFYGGTLQGVTEKIDYLAGLGVNTLWLSPIFSGPEHHGYHISDFFEIEPRLGSKLDLKELLDTAHAGGLRVLLDFVPNHVSNLHPAFLAAITDRHSPYVDWFTFHKWPDDYQAYFGVKELPVLNLRCPGARKYILDAAQYWLEFGVDGYRVDFAAGPTPDFWADFRRITRSVRPDCWTFGEMVEPVDDQIAFHGLLDGCLDFTLMEALRQTFAHRRWQAARFISFLDRHEAYFPADFSRPSFLDNHDIDRILWAAGGDMRLLKLAALCQFTLAGPPIIYYGTEVGLSQVTGVRQPDGRGLLEESRLPMLWGDDQDRSLLAFYTKLVALRNQSACLRRGERTTLLADKQVLAYRRELAGERLATVVNLGLETRQVNLDGIWSSIWLATHADCEIDPREDGCQVRLPALSGAVIT
jgi:glycosidase